MPATKQHSETCSSTRQMQVSRLFTVSTALFQTNIKTLLKHEFIITDFEEPTPSKRAIEKHYREFDDEYERVPEFLVKGSKKQ